MNKFEDIIGQEQIRDYLFGNIQSGQIAHAYMLSGENHSGKGYIADIFAASLQCEDEAADNRPCGKCHSCIQAASNNHPDIIHVTHEKPNTISVEDVREQVIADINIKPYNGRYKVYIIPEAEKMTVEAQNALLKTLEEPPEYAVIVLLTSNPSIMLQTIISRCVRLTMKPVDEELLVKYLMKELKIPDYKAKTCASFARGNLGRARELAENDDFALLKEKVLQILKHVRNMDISDTLDAIDILIEHKINIEDILEMFNVFFRDVLMYKSTKDRDALILSEEAELIEKVAESSYEGIKGSLDAVRKTKMRLKANVNYEVVVELMLYNIKENLK